MKGIERDRINWIERNDDSLMFQLELEENNENLPSLVVKSSLTESLQLSTLLGSSELVANGSISSTGESESSSSPEESPTRVVPVVKSFLTESLQQSTSLASLEFEASGSISSAGENESSLNPEENPRKENVNNKELALSPNQLAKMLYRVALDNK